MPAYGRWSHLNSLEEWRTERDKHPEWDNINLGTEKSYKSGLNSFYIALGNWLKKNHNGRKGIGELRGQIIGLKRKDYSALRTINDWKSEYELHSEWHGKGPQEMRRGPNQGARSFFDAYSNFVDRESNGDKEKKKSLMRVLFPDKKIKYSDEFVNSLCLDYAFFDESREEIAKNYGISNSDKIKHIVRRGIKSGFITPEQRDEANKRRHKSRMDKLHSEESYINTMKEVGANTQKVLRENEYNVDGRFSPASMEEGAVALMLEKYIPTFETLEGKTFQVRDKGIGNGGIDFYVNGEFLEWHPIILGHKIRGDLPTEQMLKSYNLVVSTKDLSGKRVFNNKAKDILARRYRRLRQESVDTSGYNGVNVYHAKNSKDLYNFLQNHGAHLPEYSQFKREFKEAIEKVRSYKVNKSLGEKASEAA